MHFFSRIFVVKHLMKFSTTLKNTNLIKKKRINLKYSNRNCDAFEKANLVFLKSIFVTLLLCLKKKGFIWS